MGALPVGKLSVEEYLALDRAAEIPSEYHNGEMFPMASVSWEHSIMTVNVASVLRERLSASPRCVAGGPLRVRVSPTEYVLPALIVVCGKPVLADEHQDTLINPKVILEILSPSTADYDYGHKFILYRRIESFDEYVLVAQDQARVEVYRKTPDKRWLITTYEGLDATVNVESLGISFHLAEIYTGVELPAVTPGN